MQRKVVMTWCPEDFVDPGILARAGVPFEIRNCPLNGEAQIVAAARDADAVIVVGVQQYSRRMLEQLDRCRLIEVIGIGYDGVDVAAATELGIYVANNPRYCIDELADHALALMLALARRLLPLDNAVRDGRWTTLVTAEIRTNILAPIRRLSTLTLGIVGFGNAGRMLARKARGLGMRIIAHDPYAPTAVAQQMEVPLVSLEEVLRESDFVSLHAALTNENRGMIGSQELRLMKPTAYILNVSRGGLIDQGALVSALREGQIAGAGLDVMEPEPLPKGDPLLSLQNVIITPHAAYFSQESETELWRHPFDDVVRVLSGERPVALVNPHVEEAFVRRWGSRR